MPRFDAFDSGLSDFSAEALGLAPVDAASAADAEHLEPTHPLHVLDWQALVEAAEGLAKQIAESSDEPPVAILTLARGGLPLATVLAHLLDIRELSVIQRMSYSGGAKAGAPLTPTERDAFSASRAASRVTVQAVERSLRHYSQTHDGRGSVLVVDDIADSGASLQETVDFLLHEGVPATRIHTAVWVYKPSSVVTPRYYHAMVDPSIWVVFPWERN